MPDREKVMSWLEGLSEPDWRAFHSDSEVQNIAKSALTLLKEQEAVVLCKDCRFIDESVKTRFFCGRLMRCVDADWFCADGERK